jgi:Cdc6-like AAA superfamily ATPase
MIGVQKDISIVLDIQQDQERETILNWLTPINYTSQQHDFISRRQEGTGQWLLDSPEFQNFVEGDQQTLYCPGIPGAGKTILTSIVVEDLHKRFGNDRSVGIAYLYCNFKRSYEQKLDDLLLTLVKQLAQQYLLIPDVVISLYKSCKPQQMRPSTDEILKMLYSVISSLSSVYIIIDALDECQVDDGCRPRLISEIFNLQVKYRVKFFATSRSIREITDKFKSDAWLEIRASDDDLRRYLDGRMARLPNCVSTSSDLQEKIKDTIVKSVNGMYMLLNLPLT